jgi:hypothetical protein
MSIRSISVKNLDKLTREFFEGQIDLNRQASKYSRGEIAAYYRDNIEHLLDLVREMTPEQIAYRLPGAPTGVDTSGDEAHFNTSEIVTHLASGTAFHWWGMTRALKHERPPFPRPPEGSKTTGQNKTGMGAGGWSYLEAEELIGTLHTTADLFLRYIEELPADIDPTAASRYGVFGTLTAHGWLFLAGIHSAMHLEQLRVMQAQPDYPRLASTEKSG